MAQSLVDKLDLEGQMEFDDEHPLEMRLFQYMNDLVGTGVGFKLEAKSRVSSLYLAERLICRLDENGREVYFFPGIGSMSNKTLPSEKIRDTLLGYRRDLRKENYKIIQY